MRSQFHTALSLLLLSYTFTASAQVKILFDNTKAETAGNADWVIDADNHNLGFPGPSNLPLVGRGDESNAQAIPLPAQSGVNASTVQTYWQGGLSAWGVDLAKRGYVVNSLPFDDSITYGHTWRAHDLKLFNVFVVCEPNIRFSAAEKTAILQFVQNGGGLFIIGDHTLSDRNGDGYDSPDVWNDLMTSNTVRTDPFGFSFDLVDISGTSSAIATPTDDSLIHGPQGNVTQIQWSGGTTMTLHPSANSSVRAVFYKSGTTSGNNNVMVARAFFGKGKVAAYGDSSPFDDGSGDPNDVLYDGWIADASGNHERIIMNTTIWLIGSRDTTLDTTVITPTYIAESIDNSASLQISPNPIGNRANISFDASKEGSLSINIFDLSGRAVMSRDLFVKEGKNEFSADFSALKAGIYIIEVKDEEKTSHLRFSKQ